MQRLCTKLRSLSLTLPSTTTLTSVSSTRRFLHQVPSQIHQPFHFSSSKWGFMPVRDSLLSSTNQNLYVAARSHGSSLTPFSLGQVRHVSSRERGRKRKPMTPVTSKLKKTKMKSYSSFKLRFRTLNDGTIRRWHEGKRHNAHLKSKKSKRRLRQPALVPTAYAKVMKRLNFCG